MYGLLARFAAFTGLRAGERVALRCRRLDLMRRRVEVRESASEACGALQIVATKTYESRTVPILAALIDELTDHLAGSTALPNVAACRSVAGVSTHPCEERHL